VGAKALEALGISLQTVRHQVEEIIGRGEQAPSGRIPFTAQAKEALPLAAGRVPPRARDRVTLRSLVAPGGP
jgi:hypothetical protein